MAQLHLVVLVKDSRLLVQKGHNSTLQWQAVVSWVCECAGAQHWMLDLGVQVLARGGGVGREGDLEQFPS